MVSRMVSRASAGWPLAYYLHMASEPDIHATARAFFLAKIANGALPEHVVGGQLDGLLYFPISVAGVDYWLTQEGLFTPPHLASANEGACSPLQQERPPARRSLD
jgi:hypothetical protein